MKPGEIIHRKAQLITVGAGLPRALRTAAADAGIVDKKLEPFGGLLHRLGQTLYVG
jgi:hypothetical protein